jgi:hypothetical protein
MYIGFVDCQTENVEMTHLNSQQGRVVRDAMIMIGDGMRKLFTLSMEPHQRQALQCELHRACYTYLLATLDCEETTVEAFADFIAFDAVAESHQGKLVGFQLRKGRPKKVT